MKRIGILTFHRALNYGAVLQAYALQQSIARLSSGFEVKVIDYRCPAIEATRELGQAEYRQGLLKGTLLHWLHHPFQRQRLRIFDDFLAAHLASTEPFDRPTLDALNERFDVLVSGSDQVWNAHITHGDASFFLDFAHGTRRVAYAASFGARAIDPSQHAFFRRHLASMDHLSIREQSAAAIVEGLIDRRPPVVLDPTLLLTREDWAALSTRPASVKGKRYILIYNMVPTHHLIDFARDLARRTGCTLRLIGHGIRHLDIPHVRVPTPAEFVGLFQNAEYVVANSFHGMAFAINFERPFFTETMDATGKLNTRVQNLIDLCGLQRRSLENGRFVGDPTSTASIDWAAVRQKLDVERAQSLAYLRSALSG